MGEHRAARRIVAGLFVGGRSRRMGGRPKGLLVAPNGETIVVRFRRLFDAAAIPYVLVGEHESYPRELPAIADAAPGAGPLGGLVALLEHAGDALAIAVACDMPYVSEALLRRLIEAPPAAAIAARREGRWEPFFARYDAACVTAAARARLHAGRHALQGLLDEVGARELSTSAEEQAELRDWDTPDDLDGRLS